MSQEYYDYYDHYGDSVETLTRDDAVCAVGRLRSRWNDRDYWRRLRLTWFVTGALVIVVIIQMISSGWSLWVVGAAAVALTATVWFVASRWLFWVDLWRSGVYEMVYPSEVCYLSSPSGSWVKVLETITIEDSYQIIYCHGDLLDLLEECRMDRVRITGTVTSPS